MYKNASDGLNALYSQVNHQEKKLIENKEEIKDLKEKIKALKAELDVVKEENQHYQDCIEEALNICGFSEGDSVIDAVKTLKEENDKLIS